MSLTIPFQAPVLADITDPELTRALQARLDQKTKPIGSLGAIESLARQLGEILGTCFPSLQEPQLVVFAADHGLVARGVSAYPSDVTWQMVENFLAGGAAVSVLARQHGIAMSVVDCGVAHGFGERPHALAGTLPRLLSRKVGHGTADAGAGPAMSQAQCAAALRNGSELIDVLPGNVVLLGEMGIGNSSSAAMLLSRLSGLDIGLCTGAGTGLDAAAVARKTEVLRAALQLHASASAPLDVLAALGGFEIATMTGSVLRAAEQRRVILVDGFIASAAVLVAHALQPKVLQRCVFAHRSGERGHAHMLQYLDVLPLLNLGLRLGEGSGAALAWPLLVSACALLAEMASFESAGVSGQSAAGSESDTCR